MASLIVKTGHNKGDYYPLGHRTNVVGRAESLPIQILDEKVSRKHMQIGYDKTRECYYVLDMKSKHGVFVNNKKILEETELKDADEIIIGETTLLFTLEDFSDNESAMSYYNKVGEKIRPTLIQ